MKKKKTVPMKQAIPRSEEAPPDASVEIPVDMSVSTPVADTFSHSDEVFPIVGIGASAGGLEKTRKELAVIKIAADEVSEYAESVINTVREPLIVLDQDLRVVTASRSFYEVFKVNPEETMGQLIYDLGNKQWDIPKLRELLETILPEKATFDNYEVEHDFADIGRRIVLLNARQIQRASGKERIILLAIEDITERKRAEEELLESEGKYRNILENIEDGYFEVDLAGNFTFFNPSLCRILGYPREEMPGMNNRVFMDAENAKKVFQAFNEIYVTGIPQKGFGWETIRKDGARTYIEVSVSLIARPEEKPTGFRGIARDITARKQAERELRKSEEKFRNLVESISDVIYEIDSQGVIVYVSPIIKDVLGHDPADIIGKKFIELVYKDDRSRLIERFSELREGIEYPLEYRFISKSGDIRWVRTKTRPIMEDGGFSGARGTFIDVTERKRAEEALRESESLFHSLIDYMHDAMIILNWDGSILFANRAAAKIIEYERAEELVGHNIVEYLHPNSLQKAAEDLEAVKADKMDFLSEYQLRSVTGQHIWVESIGGKIIFRHATANLACIRDITERKRAEKILIKSEARLTEAQRIAHLGNWDWDIEKNEAQCSDETYRIFGFSSEELNWSFEVFVNAVHPEDRERVIQARNEALNGGKPFSMDFRIVQPDGSERIVHGDAEVIINANGKPIYMVGTDQDITERKRAEKEVSETLQQLQDTRDILVQFEKHAAIGRLAAGVAHEILNPVSIISSRLQFLEAENLSEPARENVRVSREQLKRIVKISRNLYQSAAKQPGMLVGGDLRRVIEVGLQMTERRIKEDHIQVEYNPPSETIPVKMERDRLVKVMVMVNLILNACDAMTGNQAKRLIVTIHRPEDSSKDYSIFLTVADNGHGIPAGDLDKIFEPFFTTKDPGKGTGLGLSVSKGIVQEHGGTIHAENNDMGGASFIVELPLDHP
jgi:PAS domain S-box-containing protein